VKRGQMDVAIYMLGKVGPQRANRGPDSKWQRGHGGC